MGTSKFENSLGQPIGFPVPEWRAAKPLTRDFMVGRYARLEPLSVERHAKDLFAAYAQDEHDRVWTYLPYGPFRALADFQVLLDDYAGLQDPMFFTVCELPGDQASGVASYLRIQAEIGVIEIGHINFSPRLQRTRAATEAIYLMMHRAFDGLGYRRLEWKCDALNQPSRKAAERLGFSYEGVFRQATMYKGRNRDTAWYSIIDSEWPGLSAALQAWLEPNNFDSQGAQQKRLCEFMPGQH